MEHPNIIDKNHSIEWARKVMSNKSDYLILDTETTGLGDKDIVIQIAVIDLDGNTIIDSLVKPTKRKTISRDATAIHGIKMRDLQESPHFADVISDLLPHINMGKSIIVYNMEFDSRMMNQTLEQDGVDSTFKFKGYCLMKAYAQFVGQWNPLTKEYKYQRLNGNHTAIGDCLSALEVIKEMASQDFEVIPKGYKPSNTAHKNAATSNFGCIVAVAIISLIILLYLISKI